MFSLKMYLSSYLIPNNGFKWKLNIVKANYYPNISYGAVVKVRHITHVMVFGKYQAWELEFKV